MVENRWNRSDAAGLSESELLLYRSHLLGADLAVTNFGGGNTSAKIDSEDPLTGESVPVLWVKGSGGDLGSMGLDGFSTLYLDRIVGLERRYRGLDHEDEMVELYPHCVFANNPRAPSIDTPLHAFLPYAHVDHVHPDSLIALAAAKNGKRIVEEAFEGRLGWLDWQRPGFDLALRLRQACEDRPDIDGLVLGGHGLITWAEDAETCYATTIDVIRRAEAWFESKGAAQAFGPVRHATLALSERRRTMVDLLPRIRGLLGEGRPDRLVGHCDDSPEVLEFVGSERLEELAALGTSCPDHFLRTKIRPLVIDPASALDAGWLDGALGRYRDDYQAYYERCRRPNSPPMRDPNPVVYLTPGVGMITFAKDKATARIASEFYRNAIAVMRGACAVDDYQALQEQEAFDIEYWQLEEDKLRRQPKPKELAGRIALVTGGAGGIGRATARRLAADGACVVLADIDELAVETARRELADEFGGDAFHAVSADVTNEESVASAFEEALRAYGGLDIVVSNAGIASAAPIEETSVELWERNQDVLSKGYFLVAREAMRTFLRQGHGLGGSIIFVASKNALVASPGAAAYCTAKASELHLARCVALEGAPHGIRVNSVNPDAVISGSSIWKGDWSQERAAAHGIAESELDEHYRNRSLLKRSVLPEDVAEAIHFLASDRSAKSTGNVLNVDAGNAAAFPR